MFGRGTHGGEPRLVLRDVGPRSAEIPEWMTKPAAAALSIHAPPRLSLDCLQDLRGVLDVILSVADDESQAETEVNDPVSLTRAIGAVASKRPR